MYKSELTTLIPHCGINPRPLPTTGDTFLLLDNILLSFSSTNDKITLNISTNHNTLKLSRKESIKTSFILTTYF